jgi:hypothetical protein
MKAFSAILLGLYRSFPCVAPFLAICTPKLSEAASPNRRCSQRDRDTLHLAGLSAVSLEHTLTSSGKPVAVTDRHRVALDLRAPTPYVWIVGRTKTDGP